MGEDGDIVAPQQSVVVAFYSGVAAVMGWGGMSNVFVLFGGNIGEMKIP